MPAQLRDDVFFVLLQKIHEAEQRGDEQPTLSLADKDLTDASMQQAILIEHLNYLTQKGFLEADFAKATSEEQAENRDLVTFSKAHLTDKGQQILEKMEANPPKSIQVGKPNAIDTDNLPFLEKVMVRGEIYDIFDARDIAEVVYRVMRDLMTTEVADRVADELQGTPTESAKGKSLQNDVAQLWRDTNPLVGFLSRIRPPLQGSDNQFFNITDDRFIFRVANESGMSKRVDPERAIKAVFSATKEELTDDRVREVATWLPGRICDLWETA